MARRKTFFSMGLAAALISSALLAGPVQATLPGETTDLYVATNQYDPDTSELSFSGFSRYNSSGTFQGGTASCADAGASLQSDPNSRSWWGSSAWGEGGFVACDDGTGDSDIYFLPFDFSAPTQVTMFAGDHYDPAISPDGGSLAFSSDYEGRRQICVLDIGDTTPDCLTGSTHEGEDWAPVWNPHWDGALTFVSNIDGDADIYSLAPPGEGPSDWYNYPATDNETNDFGPDFHPVQMDIIVYSSNVNGFDQLFTMNLNDREPHQLTSDSNSNYEPVYSPDGSQIAFVKQAVATPGSFGRTYLMPASGGAGVALDTQSDAAKEYTHPEWAQESDADTCEPNCEPPNEERWFGVFKLVKHLKVTGQLFSESGDDGCLVGQSVKIQKKKSTGWKTLKTVTTGFEGTFKTAVPDKPGKYRGVVAESETDGEFPVTCLGATSAIKRHRH